MRNQKPNSRSRADTPNKSKPIVTDGEKQSQNPPEIIVLPDKLPDNKPNIEPTKPVEKPPEDKPSGEKPSDKK